MRIRNSLAGLALGLAACADAPPHAPPAVSLSGTRWIGAMPADTDPRTIPRLEFVGEGRLSGYTGCNILSGAWAMEGGDIRMGPLVTTKRLCLGPDGETARRVLAALRDGSRGRREGKRLVFTGPGGQRFEFVEAAAT